MWEAVNEFQAFDPGWQIDMREPKSMKSRKGKLTIQHINMSEVRSELGYNTY